MKKHTSVVAVSIARRCGLSEADVDTNVETFGIVTTGVDVTVDAMCAVVDTVGGVRGGGAGAGGVLASVFPCFGLGLSFASFLSFRSFSASIFA